MSSCRIFLRLPASLEKSLVVWGMFFTCFLLSLYSKAQFKTIAQIDTVASAVFIDNLDFTYLLTTKDELLKYDQKGNLKWRYSNNRFGKIKSVDVSDPLRVVLFFADFQQVIVLNNNLNEIAKYSFARNGNLLISALASSNNNGFWAFDSNNIVLLKLSQNFTEDTRSANLFQIFDEVIILKKLIAADQFVYLQKKNNDILQFDRFGAYVKQLPIDSLTDFNITSNNIAYWRNNVLYTYNPVTLEEDKRELSVNYEVKQVAIGNKIIVALTEKAVFLLSGK